MDPIKTLGTILKEDVLRDAIHLAIMPVITADEIYAGERVKLIYGTKNFVKQCGSGNDYVGIIDPFLESYIPRGSRVWMFLRPNTIIGLRHEWTHPEVDNTHVPDNEHEAWLKSFACQWNFDYDTLISEASSHINSSYEHGITAQGVDLHSRSELGEDHDKFWQHMEALTGKKFGNSHREQFYWSCSC